MPAVTVSASLSEGEAVLRFPYDDGLRRLLRAVPGRRWDARDRSWRLPLEPEQARALELLLAGLPAPPLVSDDLARALSRASLRRRRGAPWVLDLVRPDEQEWLGFPLDAPGVVLERLLAHPGALRLAEIGRGLVPGDEPGLELAAELAGAQDVRISPRLARALEALEHRRLERREQVARERSLTLRRDRSGARWVLAGPAIASAARAEATRLGLRVRPAPAGSTGIEAREHDAESIGLLLSALEEPLVDPLLHAWLAHSRRWRGTVAVCGPPAQLLLLGDPARLPVALRDRSVPAEGGAVVPLDRASALLARELRGWTTPAARRCLAAVVQDRPAPAAVLERSRVHEAATFVLAPGHDPARTEAFAAVAGALPPAASGGVEEHRSLPALGADAAYVPVLDRLLEDGQVWVEPDALELLQDLRQEHARAAGVVALSGAADAPLAVAGLGGELKPFQRAGVAYLLERRRALLADEQGLGKTIQALAALEAAGTFPAIVVCPAALRLNWLREARHWLPRRSCALVPGGKGVLESGTDVAIVGYELLARRDGDLGVLPRALVIDESHYCKNGAARRTQAVQRLASRVPADGLVLALSGTPVVNRPAELAAQLRILGRLEEFGSGAGLARRFRGPDALLRLHWHLRARCMARRLKRDVLPQLPAKTRAIVPMEIDNEAEYRLAERDLVGWLQSQPLDLRELDARVAAALRAERLVRLGALKLLAARGKLAGALRWVHDFCASGERLVLFARHREIQHAVLERFPNALRIVAEDAPAVRERSIERFQAGESSLIVCSLEAAGHGITLTGASNVAFLELDWTPARHEQAEDRCHRIGQHDAVMAYYLLAAHTIDERIATLLEEKRALVGAVTDGRSDPADGVLERLVDELRARPYRHLHAVG